MFNEEQLTVISNQTDLWNYDEFITKCSKNNRMPLDVWMRELGLYCASKCMFKDKCYADGRKDVLRVISDQTMEMMKLQGIPIAPQTKELSMSVGIGDTIAKITEATGLDKLAEMYMKITGKPCNCKNRQEALNLLFPYKVKGELI